MRRTKDLEDQNVNDDDVVVDDVNLFSEVQLTVGVWSVSHGRPGEVDDVKTDKAALQQPGVGLVLLDDGQHRSGRRDDAEDHVEGDEELVQLALPDPVARVVAVGQDDPNEGGEVEDSCDGEEGVEPVLTVVVAMVVLPGLCPGVGKVDDEDELDDDEHEAAEHAKVHPGGAEVAVGDEEGSDAAGDDDQVLEAPEAVLDARPWVPGVPHPDHDHRHEEEEDGDDKADPIDRQVSYKIKLPSIESPKRNYLWRLRI